MPLPRTRPEKRAQGGAGKRETALRTVGNLAAWAKGGTAGGTCWNPPRCPRTDKGAVPVCRAEHPKRASECLNGLAGHHDGMGATAPDFGN